MYNVVKKDGTIEAYDEQKIINACNKAARRAMYELSEKDYSKILNDVFAKIEETYDDDTDIEIYDMHNIVDRKSTRLNSSHVSISYAVFCLKKKKNKK